MDLDSYSHSPLFSIIIANYNNGQYLQECIDSIIHQTYTKWEIILVDDCSTDNSHELYKIYEEYSQIKILYNDTNRGVGYTKKRAVDNTSGEYIGIVDPDDKITPDAIATVLNGFLNHTTAAIVYTNHFICDDVLNITKVSTNSGKIPNDESQLSYNGPKIGPFWAFNKSMYYKTSGFNPKFRTAEDQDLYYKLEEIGKLKFIDKPCYYYRYHINGISTSNNFFQAYYSNINAMKIANARRKKNKLEIKCLSKRGLSERWLFYYHGYSLRLIKQNKKYQAFILLIKSLRFILYDKNLLSVKIIVKYIFLNNELPVSK
jgi:glycosyltransferase involved in cell wall biosynthesis